MHGLNGNPGLGHRYDVPSFSKVTTNYMDLCASFSTQEYSPDKFSYADTMKTLSSEKDATAPPHATNPLPKYPLSTFPSKTNSFNVKTYGETDDAYEIGKEIGSGAYATVRECTLPSQPGKKFAVKIYNKQRLLSSEILLNIRREMSILESLNHPNIVRLYETIESTKSVCLIFEYLKGGSVADYMHTKLAKHLDELEAKRLFLQTVKAVQYLSLIHICRCRRAI
eukprot:TRINITY_DN10867_c0_g1_i3.p1 TRINITY_DN10867_c0_g1~~TRINITY_DN10867_c0_g1_i3.p1  ORF type:complete len:225 (-),score=40.65 TRINITY_DN10867_c0_g1_i3:23-697(-)